MFRNQHANHFTNNRHVLKSACQQLYHAMIQGFDATSLDERLIQVRNDATNLDERLIQVINDATTSTSV